MYLTEQRSPLKQYEHFLTLRCKFFIQSRTRSTLSTDILGVMHEWRNPVLWKIQTFGDQGQMCDKVAYFALSSELQFMAGSSFQVFS